MDILRLERLGAPVASGGQLITGQNPHSSGPAASTLLAKLGEIGTGPWEHHLPEDRSGPASHSPGGDWPARWLRAAGAAHSPYEFDLRGRDHITDQIDQMRRRVIGVNGPAAQC